MTYSSKVYCFLFLLFLLNNLFVQTAFSNETNKTPSFNEDCGRLLNGKNSVIENREGGSPLQTNNSPHPSTPSGLEALYSRNVAANPPSEDEKKNPHPLIDIDPLNDRKLAFIAARGPLLRGLITRGSFSLNSLRRAPLFMAEIYKNGRYAPYAWIMIMNDQVFAFDLDNPDHVEEIGAFTPGFLTPMLHALRLDQKYILTFLPDTVEFLNTELKDPEQIEIMIQSSQDPALIDFMKEYKFELERLLVTTRFTLQDLREGALVKAKSIEADAEVYFIYGKGQNTYYITKSEKALGTGRTFGELSDEAEIGFTDRAERSIQFENGPLAYMINGRFIIEDREAAMEMALSQYIKSASKSVAQFLNHFKNEIIYLAGEKILSSNFNELRSLIAVKHPVSEETYLVVKSERGFIAFGKNLSQGWAFLRDVDTERPVRWRGPKGSYILIRDAIGFQQSVSEELIGPKK